MDPDQFKQVSNLNRDVGKLQLTIRRTEIVHARKETSDSRTVDKFDFTHVKNNF